jgi:hypothetical protein
MFQSGQQISWGLLVYSQKARGSDCGEWLAWPVAGAADSTKITHNKALFRDKLEQAAIIGHFELVINPTACPCFDQLHSAQRIYPCRVKHTANFDMAYSLRIQWPTGRRTVRDQLSVSTTMADFQTFIAELTGIPAAEQRILAGN